MNLCDFFEDFDQEIPKYLVRCSSCDHLMPDSIRSCWYCGAKLGGKGGE